MSWLWDPIDKHWHMDPREGQPSTYPRDPCHWDDCEELCEDGMFYCPEHAAIYDEKMETLEMLKAACQEPVATRVTRNAISAT
jgi:hypothetical protein